jgi:hypothetical protein
MKNVRIVREIYLQKITHARYDFKKAVPDRQDEVGDVGQ